MRVLIVVDVQKDFCPGGALGVADGDQVVDPINRLIESGEYDLIIATADRHPVGHVSFAPNHNAAPFSIITIDGVERRVWPIHCVEGTPGADFHPKLKTGSFDHVVAKGTDLRYDSLSAFSDLDQIHHTELAHIIDAAATRRGEDRSAVQLTVVGLALDYCVALTALDGARLGYQTEIALDASRAVNTDPQVQLDLLRNLVAHGVNLVESRERLPGLNRERKLEIAI